MHFTHMGSSYEISSAVKTVSLGEGRNCQACVMNIYHACKLMTCNPLNCPVCAFSKKNLAGTIKVIIMRYSTATRKILYLYTGILHTGILGKRIGVTAIKR